MLSRRAQILVALSILAGYLTFAEHATAGRPRDEADKHIDLGHRLIDLQQWGPAQAEYEKAMFLVPEAGTLMTICLCMEKQGRLMAAAGCNQQALTMNKGQNRIASLDETLANALADVRARTPQIRVSAPNSPAGLVVKIDDKEVLVAGGVSEVEVDPGTHKITAEAPGYVDGKGSCTLNDGDRGERSCVVEVLLDAIRTPPHPPKRVEPVPPPPIPPPPAAPAWSGQHKAALVTGGAGLTALGVGTIFGVLALNTTYDPNHPDQWTDATRIAHARAMVCDVALVAGAALSAGGGILWLTAPKVRRAETRGPSVIPVVTGRGGGAVFHASF